MTWLKKYKFPIVTILITLVNIAVHQRVMGAAFIGLSGAIDRDFAFSWNRFTASPFSTWPTLVSYTFLHANDGHLLSNLLFLVAVAPAVEMDMGSLRFLVGYFVWGAVGALWSGYFSPFVSLVGASGAISGVMGAYFVLFPMKRPYWTLRVIPAFIVMAAFFLKDVRNGFFTVSVSETRDLVSSNVAYWGHVGGFAAGAITAFFMPRRKDEVHP